METLKLGASLVTQEPRVLLDPKLEAGTYRLQLVVVGERGESVPAEMRIIVTRTPLILTPVIPTPVIPIRR